MRAYLSQSVFDFATLLFLMLAATFCTRPKLAPMQTPTFSSFSQELSVLHAGEQVVFCADSTTFWDEPRCTTEITSAQAQHRESSERLVLKSGHTIRKDIVNGLGLLVDGGDDYASIDYDYIGDRRAKWRRFDR